MKLVAVSFELWKVRFQVFQKRLLNNFKYSLISENSYELDIESKNKFERNQFLFLLLFEFQIFVLQTLNNHLQKKEVFPKEF